MTVARPEFPHLQLEDIDARLDARAAARGIPTLTRPVMIAAAPERAGEGLATNVELMDETKPVPILRAQEGQPPEDAPPHLQPTPRSRMKPLNVELPDYVWIELKSRAAQDMVCVRHVIMSLLREAGFTISDADMIEDGRRNR